MEKLSHPSKETWGPPPPHNVENLSYPEKETCVDPRSQRRGTHTQTYGWNSTRDTMKHAGMMKNASPESVRSRVRHPSPLPVRQPDCSCGRFVGAASETPTTVVRLDKDQSNCRMTFCTILRCVSGPKTGAAYLRRLVGTPQLKGEEVLLQHPFGGLQVGEAQGMERLVSIH